MNLIATLMGVMVSASAGLSCPGDVDGDGSVGVVDLVRIIGVWGPCAGCPEDVDGSGAVDVGDLLLVILDWGPCPELQAVELAGRALPDFPHFAFVHAFNEGTIVQVAIDPANLPAPDLACDVYVVAARTASEWDADPTLVDVRGAPQPAVFDGATIRANTIDLIGSDGLDGRGGGDPAFGPAFGVDYDVVCDVNGNGLLDGGDLIDGPGDGGLTVVRDITAPGPHGTSSLDYSGGFLLDQRTFYPASIESLPPRPLVVISHGNGHDHDWYDYLQSHLASYGYVVMSHENNTQPGIESASTTTLTNTDYFLANLDSIGGGILDGHVDSGRITWIGHSRGGEGVARAYDRLFDGDYVPVHFDIGDIRLVSSIAPNDYLGMNQSDPHGVHYHLLIGAADGDNGGWPDLENDAPFHVLERAEGYRHATNVHGADHNDFNCCGFNDFVGPPGTAIGRPEAQRVARGVYLALIAHYVDGNRAARDFLWRPYEVLRPLGVDPGTIVDHEFIEGPNGGLFVIDDFQSQFSLSVSSSGGAVTGTVEHRVEARHDDTDGTFTWSLGDPMNGFSRGRPDDTSRGTVFDWSADRFLEFEVVPRDLTAWTYLTFRSCQGTRHPFTVAEIGDTTFTVTLRDGAGGSSSVDIGAYGAGVREPYQRTGSGSGAGWQNEYETIRLRLTDFLHDGAELDLTDVVAVRFDFGPSYGSSRGRIGLDDLALSRDAAPEPPRQPAAGGPGDPLEGLGDDRPEWHGVGPGVDGAAPVSVLDVLAARPFTLGEPYVHQWRHERPPVTSGWLLVLRVDPSLVTPRQSLEPVLYADGQTLERLSVAHRSGILAVIVPGEVEPGRTRIWFGAPALPEQVGRSWVEREHARAVEAGLRPTPWPSTGPRIEMASKTELARYAGTLFERYAAEALGPASR